MKARRKRILRTIAVVVLLPTLACGLLLNRRLRQERLDRELIAAIKKRNAPRAIALLNQGADANATDRPYKPITLKSLLWDFWDRSKGVQPPPQYPSALRLAYGPILFMYPGTPTGSFLDVGDLDEAELFKMEPYLPTALVLALLDHGARLDTPDRVGEVLLKYACITGDVQTLKVLLAHHIDPNARGGIEIPPLMLPRDNMCARILLEAGADPNDRDSRGRTRLMYPQNSEQYLLLFAHGADPNLQNSTGETALMELLNGTYTVEGSSMFGNTISEGVPLLLQHGAKVALKDKEGKTALDYAKQYAKDRDPEITANLEKQIVRPWEAALKREWTQQKATGKKSPDL